MTKTIKTWQDKKGLIHAFVADKEIPNVASITVQAEPALLDLRTCEPIPGRKTKGQRYKVTLVLENVLLEKVGKKPRPS